MVTVTFGAQISSVALPVAFSLNAQQFVTNASEASFEYYADAIASVAPRRRPATGETALSSAELARGGSDYRRRFVAAADGAWLRETAAVFVDDSTVTCNSTAPGGGAAHGYGCAATRCRWRPPTSCSSSRSTASSTRRRRSTTQCETSRRSSLSPSSAPPPVARRSAHARRAPPRRPPLPLPARARRRRGRHRRRPCEREQHRACRRPPLMVRAARPSSRTCSTASSLEGRASSCTRAAADRRRRPRERLRAGGTNVTQTALPSAARAHVLCRFGEELINASRVDESTLRCRARRARRRTRRRPRAPARDHAQRPAVYRSGGRRRLHSVRAAQISTLYPVSGPATGGETTITVRGNGLGSAVPTIPRRVAAAPSTAPTPARPRESRPPPAPRYCARVRRRCAWTRRRWARAP